MGARARGLRAGVLAQSSTKRPSLSLVLSFACARRPRPRPLPRSPGPPPLPNCTRASLTHLFWGKGPAVQGWGNGGERRVWREGTTVCVSRREACERAFFSVCSSDTPRDVPHDIALVTPHRDHTYAHARPHTASSPATPPHASRTGRRGRVRVCLCRSHLVRSAPAPKSLSLSSGRASTLGASLRAHPPPCTRTRALQWPTAAPPTGE